MSNDPSAPSGPPPAAGPPPGSHSYPPQPYGYPQPYGAPVYAAPHQGNGLAVAGMVCGIIGVVLCWAWFLGVILGALGIIFGAVGLQRANRLPGLPGRGMAIAGIACGGVAVFLDIIFIAVLFTVVHTVHAECAGFTQPAC